MWILTLHYVAPVLYVAWWLLVGRSGASRFSDIPWWLIYLLVYVVYAMVRGAIVNACSLPGFLDLTCHSVAGGGAGVGDHAGAVCRGVAGGGGGGSWVA